MPDVIRGPWEESAACRAPDVDPELFFESDKYGPSVTRVAAAKAICEVCPVRAQCLAVAEDGRVVIQYGIWGGLTADERRAERRRKTNKGIQYV